MRLIHLPRWHLDPETSLSAGTVMWLGDGLQLESHGNTDDIGNLSKRAWQAHA